MTEPPTGPGGGDDRDGVRPMPPVHTVPVTDVRESPTNPRKIPERAVELVALSIRRFGWKQPLVVDGDRNIVVGHTRHRAARSLGLTHVPVIVADDLTPEELAAYRIADNRSHDFTTWDLPELTAQLDALADDFADVLALTDWETTAAELDDAAGAATLDLPGRVVNALDGGFQLNVCFHTKEDALAAEEAILNLPGVFDVRHDF
jgi:ParB-like chromosome segregation protein Spo0J